MITFAVRAFVLRCLDFRSGSIFCAASLLTLANGWIPSPVRAELTWTQKVVELHPDAKAAVLEARFRFTNSGATPVDIRQVQTSCGCTTAAMDQRHYAPGQTGEIVARFSVGERVGLQKETVAVSTSDSPVPTPLTLVIHIPEPVRVRPAFVTWQQGDANDPKTVGLESTQPGVPLEEVSVQSSNPAVAATLQASADGRRYAISVRPTATDRPAFTVLTIRCRVGTETKNFRAFASVRALLPPATEAAPSKPPSPSPSAPDDALVPPG